MLLVASLLALTAGAEPIQAAPCPAPRPEARHEAVAVTASRTSGDSLMTVTVCLLTRPGSERIGSYHGELLFDSLTARVVRVERAPQGMRVENPKRAGRVAFAGASATGFDSGPVMTVVFRVLGGRPAGPSLQLKIHELSSDRRQNLAPTLRTRTESR